MATYTYEDFVGYYGGESVMRLRGYAAVAASELDIERKDMFLRLVKEKEAGVVFVPYLTNSTSSKLIYRRKED